MRLPRAGWVHRRLPRHHAHVEQDHH
jgi:hypothetical protein